MKITKWIALGLTVVMAAPPVQCAEQQPVDPGWPREFKQGRASLTVYQPQVVEWAGYTNATVRMAIALVPSSDKKPLYGVLECHADTVVDYNSRTVTTINGQREIRFPNLPVAEATEMIRIVNNLLPERRPLVISLDRILAYLDTSTSKPREVELNIEPPKIFHSAKPAILVMFLGEPEFKPVTTNNAALMFAVNTNWDVFLDNATSRYYLLDGESWLTSTEPLKGAWTPAGKLPAELLQLPADPNWDDVKSHIPGKPAKEVPVVLASTEPAELILTKGAPTYTPIAGTKLMRVANTESSLFMDTRDGQFYFLTAGRWFRAKSLDGPWSAASRDLPADFAMIPDNGPDAYVKASVPGTREAEDAVLLASIPQTVTVNVTNVTVQVVYQGAPQFVAIPGTTVQYVSNSPQSVFLVNGAYYCCNQAVWFWSATPTGPWTYCTSVPQAIYTIPPSSPYYNVTYVVVQQSTPTTVTYSYTSGYSGAYVATTGVLMFGAGMLVGAAIANNNNCYYCRPPPCYYSYGCGARYHYGYGGYYRAAHYSYGPYGGAGRGASYNPYTGTYARGAYAYGPNGSASVRQAYNPYTDTYAARANVNTKYGSSGRFYAEQGNKSVWGGHESGARGTVGWAESSKGGAAVGWDTKNGQGAVAKDKNGNVYVGKDGNVYKKDSNGGWSQNSGNGWDSVNKPAGTPRTQTTGASTPSARPSSSTPGTVTQPVTRPATANTSAVQQGLNRDASARSWGNQQAAQTSSYQRSGSTSGRSSFSGGGGGGGRRR